MAFLGLLSGYLALLFSVSFLVLDLTHKPDPADEGTEPATAASALSRAEGKIITDSDGVAHGNSPAAVALAKQYSDALLKLRNENFTPAKNGGISLSGGQFIVYCELRPGRCAFVVHVPNYRKFAGDAKESLAELAWESAQKTVAGSLQNGDELAVGLKGTILYGAVMVGTAGDPTGPDEQIEDEDLLLPFFEPEESTDEAKVELPPAALPAEAPDNQKDN